MKCPKCQYLTFDQGDRCRNCGYEFSLVVDEGDLDLPIRTGDEPLGPLADLVLGNAEPAEMPPAGGSFGRAASMPSPQPPVSRAAPAPELPLFRGTPGSDAPLVSLPASPRAPISVRKSTVARAQGMRTADDEPTLDLDGEAPEEFEPSRARPFADSGHDAVQESAPTAAPVGARLLGAAVDLLLMSGIDLAVLYFTLRLSELTFADVAVIPVAPFAAFIGLLNGGYLTAFTAAGGQSIGKMIAGIRVVTSDENASTDRVTLGQSTLRAVGYLVSALPAGAGFVPALIGPDHRAFHDRLAHTRVVRA